MTPATAIKEASLILGQVAALLQDFKTQPPPIIHTGRKYGAFIPFQPTDWHIVTASTLSARQRDVLALTAQCFTTKEIALILGVSPKTIEYYRNIAQKTLKIGGTSQLIRVAVAAGLDKAAVIQT